MEIFLRAAALIVRFFLITAWTGAGEVVPAKDSNCDWRRSICVFNSTMRFNLAIERFNTSFIESDYAVFSFAIKDKNSLWIQTNLPGFKIPFGSRVFFSAQ